jgi:hypothetical protein
MAPRPDSFTGISRTAPNPRSPPEHYMYIATTVSISISGSETRPTSAMVEIRLSLPLSLYVKSLHRRWYRCLLMLVDPEASLRGTAGHSHPPLRLVRRRPGECRIVVEIIRLRRNLLDAPRADVLIEESSRLQRSEGRVAVWSEQRSRKDGMGDRRRRHGDARAATRGMEEHVHRTCNPCPSPSSRPNHRWAD